MKGGAFRCFMFINLEYGNGIGSMPKGISWRYIKAIQDMYDRVTTSIQSTIGITEHFPVGWVCIRDRPIPFLSVILRL